MIAYSSCCQLNWWQLVQSHHPFRHLKASWYGSSIAKQSFAKPYSFHTQTYSVVAYTLWGWFTKLGWNLCKMDVCQSVNEQHKNYKQGYKPTNHNEQSCFFLICSTIYTAKSFNCYPFLKQRWKVTQCYSHGRQTLRTTWLVVLFLEKCLGKWLLKKTSLSIPAML